MIDFFKRSELVRRGLASGKLRRRRARNDLLRGLEYSVGMKGVLFLAFIAGLALLIFSGNQQEVTKNFVIALLFFLTALMMLWINQPRTFSQSSRILLVFGVMLVQLTLTKFIVVLCQSHSFGLQPEMAELLAPYALAPLLLSVLLGVPQSVLLKGLSLSVPAGSSIMGIAYSDPVPWIAQERAQTFVEPQSPTYGHDA